MTAFLRAPPSPLLTPTLPLSRALFGRTPVSRHNVHSTFTVPRPVFPHSSGPLDRCFSTVPNFQTRRQASENHRPPTQRNCQKTNNPGGIGVDELIALGQQHVLADELESAVRAFEHAEKLAPCSVVVKAELGRALVRSGRREAGFNILVDAFKIDSLYTGIKDGFREYYRVEIEDDPDNIDLREGLAALCVDSGHSEEAAACYRRCLELTQSSSTAAAAAATPHTTAAGNGFRGVSAEAARIDRWSVALFKCNAALCEWSNWNAEARAVRAAVRRGRQPRRGGEVSRASPGVQEDDEDNLDFVFVTGLDAWPMPKPEEGDERGVDLSSTGSSAAGETVSLEREGSTAEGTSSSGVDNSGIDSGVDGPGGAVTDNASSSSPSTLQGHSNSKHDDDSDRDDDDISRPALHPFDSLSAPLSISDCLAVAQQQSRGVLAHARWDRGEIWEGHESGVRGEGGEEGIRATPSRDKAGRVRLGYVSGDLMGTHPLTHLMQSTFGMHDRTRFEVFLYALNPDDDSVQRRRMEDEVEHFRDLSLLTAREAAAAIADDGICVLVNLNGYAGTAKSPDVFALRPAPLAVSYMGFPGTMGSSELVDYLLADGVVIPPESRCYYSEKILEMPQCYFVNDYRQSELAVVQTAAPNRSDHGLPPVHDARLGVNGSLADFIQGSAIMSEDSRDVLQSVVVDRDPREGVHGDEQGNGVRDEGEENRSERGTGGVVLCNFNRLHKIDPHTFGAWMEVMRNVPGTVLWLLDGGDTARANLSKWARLAGIGEERLIFAPLVGKEEHLQRLRLADLYVDTPLYNAHTVGCDALWASVPMVTLRGAKMAARVGASLVEAAGLPELVTDSMDQYTALVQALASDDALRHDVRHKLDGARFTCPLFDTERWVRDAEDILDWAWDRHEAGLPPAHHQQRR